MKRLILTTVYEGGFDVQTFPPLKSTVDVTIDWDYYTNSACLAHEADTILTCIRSNIETLREYVDEFPAVGLYIRDLEAEEVKVLEFIGEEEVYEDE